MDFVQATSKLIEDVTLGDLAAEMGVTRGYLGQARMDPGNPQHRKPPRGWEAAVAKLARKRSEELKKIADKLGKAASSAPARAPRKAAAKKSRRRR